MKKLPTDAVAYKRTPLFTLENMPEGLRSNHQTKTGIWGLLQVERGTLNYKIENSESHRLTPGSPGVIEPQVAHCVEPEADTAFFIEFYRQSETLHN